MIGKFQCMKDNNSGRDFPEKNLPLLKTTIPHLRKNSKLRKNRPKEFIWSQVLQISAKKIMEQKFKGKILITVLFFVCYNIWFD